MTDELKPVRCGCGGEANVISGVNIPRSLVICKKCGIGTMTYDTEAEAVEAWNKAMSGSAEEKLKAFWDGMSAEKKAESAEPEERKAKVLKHDVNFRVMGYPQEISEMLCGECHGKVLDGDTYCSHCGARLEWE